MTIKSWLKSFFCDGGMSVRKNFASHSKVCLSEPMEDFYCEIAIRNWSADIISQWFIAGRNCTIPTPKFHFSSPQPQPHPMSIKMPAARTTTHWAFTIRNLWVTSRILRACFILSMIKLPSCLITVPSHKTKPLRKIFHSVSKERSASATAWQNTWFLEFYFIIQTGPLHLIGKWAGRSVQLSGFKWPSWSHHLDDAKLPWGTRVCVCASYFAVCERQCECACVSVFACVCVCLWGF